jgi:hypothetical protein
LGWLADDAAVVIVDGIVVVVVVVVVALLLDEPAVSAASAISVSWQLAVADAGAEPAVVEFRRCRLGVIVPPTFMLTRLPPTLLLLLLLPPLVLLLPPVGDCLGGAAAMGTTPGLPVDTTVEAPAPADRGERSDSPAAPLPLLDATADADVEMIVVVNWTEFLRDAAFFDRAEAGPSGVELAPPRFRFLMMSVFSDSGRTTP